jgi:hypothetical protein
MPVNELAQPSPEAIRPQGQSTVDSHVGGRLEHVRNQPVRRAWSRIPHAVLTNRQGALHVRLPTLLRGKHSNSRDRWQKRKNPVVILGATSIALLNPKQESRASLMFHEQGRLPIRVHKEPHSSLPIVATHFEHRAIVAFQSESGKFDSPDCRTLASGAALAR